MFELLNISPRLGAGGRRNWGAVELSKILLVPFAAKRLRVREEEEATIALARR
jgi:hypothetical protein